MGGEPLDVFATTSFPSCAMWTVASATIPFPLQWTEIFQKSWAKVSSAPL